MTRETDSSRAISSQGRTRPDFHQLSTFLTVVEARSFAGAARLLGKSQPAISQVIARLEEIVGGDLFERRRGAPLALTPVGESILPSARSILDTLDEQMTRAAATAQSRAGKLALGFFPGLSRGPLRAGITDFSIASPQVQLRLVEDFPGELHRQLNERMIDLMIVALMSQGDSKTLDQETLWEERLVVALPSDHALARQAQLDWHDIGGLPLILRNSHFELVAYRTLLDRMNRQVHLDQHEVSCATLLDMVGIGLGATIIFASGVAPHDGVVFRSIDEANATVPVHAVWRKDDRNPLRHRLLRLIRDHAADTETIPDGAVRPATAPTRDRTRPRRGRVRRAER